MRRVVAWLLYTKSKPMPNVERIAQNYRAVLILDFLEPHVKGLAPMRHRSIGERNMAAAIEPACSAGLNRKSFKW